MSNLKLFNKKTLMGAALLATAPTVKATGQGVSEGGKSQRGVNHLTLEEAPLENITVCTSGKSMTAISGDFRYLPDKIAVAVNPFESNFIKMTFVVSHVTASDDEKVLFLVYSQKTSPSPQIPTPLSLEKLQLDLNSAEIVGHYQVPAFGMEAQNSTRIGAGNPAARVKWEFDINLDTSEIPTMMNSGTDTIYVQAGLLKKAEFDAGNFQNMILSEMDTIQFLPNECPELMPDNCGVDRRVTEFEFEPLRSENNLTTCSDSSGIVK